MFPADRIYEPVTVEYDFRNGRRSKTFTYPHKAKQFYVSKSKLGKHPTVQRSDTMAKKTTKKATAKKATKTKTAKKKSSAKKETTPRRTANGLTKSQLKVLQALKNTTAGNRELDRKALNKATGISKGWSKLLGAGTREGMGVHGDSTMGGLGLIGISQYEGSRTLMYYITAKGKKMLEAASKG